MSAESSDGREHINLFLTELLERHPVDSGSWWVSYVHGLASYFTAVTRFQSRREGKGAPVVGLCSKPAGAVTS